MAQTFTPWRYSREKITYAKQRYSVKVEASSFML